MFENPRRGRQARNFTTNVPKILDLKSSSEQIFSENCRWVPLVIVVSGRHDLPFDARAFSLTSFEMQCSSLLLNKGFRLFNFLQSASWIRIIISDFLLVRECDGFLRCFVTR